MNRVLVLSAFGVVGLLSETANAHGSSGTHDSPLWCGNRVAVLSDEGLLLVEGTSVRTIRGVPREGVHAWSPDCSRIVVASERVWIIDVERGSLRVLGPIPGGFSRASRLDGTLPSIRFSPSGRNFALPVVRSVRMEEALYLFNAVTGTARAFALARGEVHAFAFVDEETVLAGIVPGSFDRPVQLFRATTTTASRLNNIDYHYVRMSVAPVQIGAQRLTGEFERVDPVSGASQHIDRSDGYVRTMAWNGSRMVFATSVSAPSVSVSMRTADFGTRRLLALPGGITADEHYGLNNDATFGVFADRGRLLLDDGQRATGPRVLRVFSPQREGNPEHISVSPDGTQVAFLLAHAQRPRGPRQRRCDFESDEEVSLYVGTIGNATFRRVAAVSLLHHCGIE